MQIYYQRGWMATTILIADDHEIIVESLKAIVNTEKRIKTVATANNGQRVIEMARELQPDIVLVDISMPVLNGFETTLRLQAVSPGTRVIALSMHTEHQIVRRMLRAGAWGYLLKDAARKELISAVRSVLAGIIYISQTILDNGFELELYRDEGYLQLTKGLSVREREVLQMILEGCTTKTIAERLEISIKTVHSHRKHIMDKLAVHGIVELTRSAIETVGNPLACQLKAV